MVCCSAVASALPSASSSAAGLVAPRPREREERGAPWVCGRAARGSRLVTVTEGGAARRPGAGPARHTWDSFPARVRGPEAEHPAWPGPPIAFWQKGKRRGKPALNSVCLPGTRVTPHAGQTDGVAARTPVLVAAGDAAEAGAEDTQPPVSGSPSPAGGGVPEMHQTLDGRPGILRHFCSQRQGGRHEFLSPRTRLFPFYSGLSRNRSFLAWHHCYGVRCVHVSRLRVPVTRASAEAVFAHTVK